MSELVWRAGLDDTEIAAVRELARAAADADGVAPLSDHVLRHLGRGGTEAAHLLARDGARVIGVAHLDRDDPDAGDGPGVVRGSGELTVHPQDRRAGLGTAMVRELGGAAAAWRDAAAVGARRSPRLPSRWRRGSASAGFGSCCSCA